MNTKGIKFLRRSFAILVLVCIIVFVVLTSFMSKRTQKAVNEITNIYMSEINEQIQQKFIGIAQLRIDQVQVILQRTPSNANGNLEKQLDELKLSAELRDFTWLGIYIDEDTTKTIYGEDIEIFNSDIEDSLEENGNIITYGYGKDNEKLFVFGVEAEYEMHDGTKGSAMLAAIPMKYLEDILFKNEDKQKVYSHLIDHEGNFVIRTGEAYRDSYFDRIQSIVDDFEGKQPQDYVDELKQAMDQRKDYITTVYAEGEFRHLSCSALADNSNWYVVTVMSDQLFSDIIKSLNRQRNGVMILSFSIILLILTVIFRQYLKFSREQMRMLERSREEAQRASMAKTDFLSSMSHDIRTPMNAIVGMTEIAERNVGDTMRVEDCLRKIKLSSKHLLGLINDVLDMSKIESGKLTLSEAPMSLRDTMDDIVNIIQPQVKARRQYFDIYIQDVIAENVYCDSVRMNQVLLNLLSNALKYTEEEGRINVLIWQEPSERGEDYVRTHFKVEDNGIGMSKEFQEKIFDSFARENTQQVNQITGTGLGMAITKSIIDIMGGTIELASELGKGSKFHITVDLKKADVTEQEMKLPNWNVLVVDDDDRLCQSATANLEEMGVHAEWTTDGREAIKMIEDHHERGEDYRFVLIDWKMPYMDGIQTIREIHKDVGKDVPVFLISAYDWNDVEEALTPADDIEGFISKPLFKSTLYSHLNRYTEDNQVNKEVSDESENEDTCLVGKHILLSEDIDLNWEIAYEILSEFGLELERAVNGKECVEMFEKADIGYYDAILMDIRMPVMNGYEATQIIRALGREDSDLPIIAMTADAFSDDAQRCLECGMNAHITKPIDIKECKRILKKYLQG